MSCAERIVAARIAEVWVGIEDPHPKVAGKGIAFLKRHGVTVHIFDRDLQELIKKENSVFLALAEQKAEEERRPQEEIASQYETPTPNVSFSDLSKSALERYKSSLGFQEPIDSKIFLRRLLQHGLVEESHGGWVPTGFGTMLFGEHPRDSFAEAGLLGTIHYEDGREEIRDFDGPMVFVPELSIQWLKDKLPNPIDRSGVQRKEANEKFFELVREGIVNALVHRDYAISGAKCQLVVTRDVVIIKSPGRPIEPITIEQLQSFSAPMLSRNPRLHAVFAHLELAEERGLGLKSMQNRATEVGLTLPKYSWEPPYLVLTLYRSTEGALRNLDLLRVLSKEEQIGWAFVSARLHTTQSEYAQHLGITARTAQRHLAHFVELGLLRRIGRGPATEYLPAQS